MNKREDLYPEPLSFRPKRFLGRTFSPFEFAPFGGSVRRCIGAAFALYEMKIVLATVLSRAACPSSAMRRFARCRATR